MKALFALLLLAPFQSFAADNGICYGGPGYYPYPCPKPVTPATCYGGPGNYPYPCPVKR